MDELNINKGIFVGGIIAIAFLFGRGMYSAINENKRDSLCDKIKIIADSDEDGIVSDKEWGKAFREMGYAYDSSYRLEKYTGSQAMAQIRAIPTSNLERYVENHQNVENNEK